jgi:preprotein translocase subunit SecE
MNAIFNYFAEARAELAKVNWPTRPQIIRLTILVIVFCAVMAAFLGTIDYIFAQGLQKIILKG